MSDDGRKSRQSPGRRWTDELTVTVGGIGKLAVAVIAACSTVFLAGIGAATVGYSYWQDFKMQIARDKTPPAFIEQQPEKK